MRGVHLTARERNLVWRFHCELGMEPHDIWLGLFGDSGLFTEERIGRLCRWLRGGADEDSIIEWLLGPIKRGGRNRLMDENADLVVASIMEKSNRTRGRLLRDEFRKYLEDEQHLPSRMTLFRSRVRCRITRKIATRLNGLANPEEQLDFMEAVDRINSLASTRCPATLNSSKTVLPTLFRGNQRWCGSGEWVVAVS